MRAPQGVIAKPKKFRHTATQIQLQHVMVSDATDIGAGGGSRSGKTFEFCFAVATRALKASNSRHAILRFRQNAITKAVVNDTWPKMLDLCYPGTYNEKRMNKTLGYYTMPNDSEVWFGGLDDKERVEAILGNEYATMYFNECSQIPWTSVDTALSRLAMVCPLPDGSTLPLKAYYDFNPPSKRHWTYLYFISKLQPDTRNPILRPENIAFLFMNPMDNEENLDPKYLERLNSMSAKNRKRFFLGQFADEDADALWQDADFDTHRILGGDRDPLPDMVRITVNVDPMGMADDDVDKKSDEVGITVTGLGTDGYGYLLEDLSGHYGPSTWSKIVGDAFKRHLADCVVAEANYGGGMVKFTIEAGNADGEMIPVKLVTASRGKVLRAEPISALYKRGRIRHYGHYPECEEQACDFYPDGYHGPKSPDRWDSAVFGFTELFPGLVKEETSRIWVPPGVQSNTNRASDYRNSGTPGLPNRGRP